MHPDEIAIRVRNLSKCYQIYYRPHDRLKPSIIPRLQRLTRQPQRKYYREFLAFPKLPLRQGYYVWRVTINDDGGLLAMIIVSATGWWAMPTLQIQAVDFLTFVGWALPTTPYRLAACGPNNDQGRSAGSH